MAAPRVRNAIHIQYGMQETIFHNILEVFGENADAELFRIAKEIVKTVRPNVPVRGQTPYSRKPVGGEAPAPSKMKRGVVARLKPTPGELRKSLKAKRIGKRYRQEGKWKFFTTKIAIRMKFYGMFIDRGWVHAKSGRYINGTAFLTREINRRLISGARY